MKKVVEYIEKYIEWLVLGLAVLWLGWVAIAYWVQQPVQVEVGGVAMPPEAVDPYIATNLDPRAEKAHATPAPPLADRPSDPRFLEAWVRAMDTMPPPSSALVFVGPSKPLVSNVPTTAGTQMETNATLAKVAPPILEGISRGTSVLMLPPSIANLAGGAGVPVVQPVVLPPSSVAGGAAAAAPAGPPPIATDSQWVALTYRFDVAKQLQEFQNAAVPNFLLNEGILVLRVELQREELQPDGQWTAPAVVQEFGVNPLQAYPRTGNDAVAAQYATWANEHEKDILNPTFYPLSAAPAGDTPWTVLQVDPNKGAAVRAFDVRNPPPPPYTLDEERQLAAYKIEQDRIKATQPRPTVKPPVNQNPTPTPPSSGGRSRRGGAGQNPAQPSGGGQSGGGALLDGGQKHDSIASAANDNMFNRPNPSAPSAAPTGIIAMPGTPAAGAGGAPTTSPVSSNEIVVDPAITAGLKLAPTPTAAFKPTQEQDFEIEAYDVGIVGQAGNGPQSGHIYRYKAVLKLANPVWRKPQVVKDPQGPAVTRYDLVGESDWSPQVFIPRLRHFFVADNAMGSGVKMEVYEWKAGRWTVRTLQKLAAGDAIGDTGATIVDLRPDWRDQESKIVLVAHDDGTLEQRTYKTDQNDPERRFLAPQAIVIHSPTASASGGGGGNGY